MAYIGTGTGYDELLTADSLSEIRFVHEYVQFVFWPLTLSVYANVGATSAGVSLHQSDSGYYDTICRLIGQKIVRIERNDNVEMTLQFSGGAVLSISLVPTANSGPEIAMLSDQRGVTLMVEQYGE
jgi:hypothetical protein